MVATVVDRYVYALFNITSKEGVAESVQKDLAHFLRLCQAEPKVITYLVNPLIHQQIKEKLLDQLARGFEKRTKQFLKLVIRKNRVAFLCDIANKFITHYNQNQQLRAAHVTAAHPIPDHIRAKLITLIQKLTHCKEVTLTVDVDPRLLGGYVLRLGDYCLDASVQAKLKQLRQRWCNTAPHTKA